MSKASEAILRMQRELALRIEEAQVVRLVQLPLDKNAGPWSVNPHHVVSVAPTGKLNVTAVTVLEEGTLQVALSYTETLARLRGE